MASKKGYWRSYGNHGKGICCAVLYGQSGCCTVTNCYTTGAFRAGNDGSLTQEPPIVRQRGARVEPPSSARVFSDRTTMVVACQGFFGLSHFCSPGPLSPCPLAPRPSGQQPAPPA